MLLLCLVSVSFALNVVVIGGGPSGLCAALVARSVGATVTVVEKRAAYSRPIAFDVASYPWGEGLEVLRGWIEDDSVFARTPGVDHIATAICNVLEQRLHDKAVAMGVTMQRGRAWDASFDVSAFDVVIGADGASSTFREAANVSFPYVEEENVQHSVLLEFVECPRERPGFHSTRVFRRFFDVEHCHLQVLLDEKKPVTELWSQLWHICQEATTGMHSLHEFKANVRHVEVLSYAVRHASKATFFFGSQVGLLMGDALVSAHYRLGIGLNNMLNSLAALRLFLQRLQQATAPHEVAALVRAKNEADMRRVQAVAAFQNEVIAVEQRCSCRFDPPELSDDFDLFDDQIGAAAYAENYFLPRIRVFRGSTELSTAEAQRYCRAGNQVPPKMV